MSDEALLERLADALNSGELVLKKRLLSEESVERIRLAALAPLAADNHETLREALEGVLDD